MFTSFNIDLSEGGSYYITNFYSKGLAVFENNKKDIKCSLDAYIDEDGTIDGNKLQEDWFHSISTDVFRSHSHKDEKLAISIAGWLNYQFNLSPFVDSCLWHYSDDLLSLINNKYNIIRMEEDGTIIYSHKKASYASSHVNMMLTVALNKMINKAECVFFINTPNSSIKSQYSEYTKSPWIYFEIITANTIARQYPRRIEKSLRFEKRAAMYESGELNVKYLIDLSKFIQLDKTGLQKWEKGYDERNHPLDELYKQTRIYIPN